MTERAATAVLTDPGAERVESRLERLLAAPVVVRHHVALPAGRGEVDHVVIAPTGVWLVDSRNHRGEAETRPAGAVRAPTRHLFVNGRDQSRLVDVLLRQVTTVRSMIDPWGFRDVAVRPAMLFPEAEWGWFAKPIELDGVLALWTDKLVDLVHDGGHVTPDRLSALASLVR